jgi:hypothetical protein
VTQELAHCSGVTHEEAFNVRRLIAGFSLNLPQEWRGVLVCSRREVKGQNVSLKTATVHSDIIVSTAEMTEHSFKLMFYCDMPAGLHIAAGHSHAIPNWPVHGASILEENRVAEPPAVPRNGRRTAQYTVTAKLPPEIGLGQKPI